MTVFGAIIGSISLFLTFFFVDNLENNIVHKGTFNFNSSYPKNSSGYLLNFHTLRKELDDGEEVNYFIFKSSDENAFERIKKFDRESLFSTIEPCAGLVDSALERKAQRIGGNIFPVDDQASLSNYIPRQYIEGDDLIFIAVNKNMAKYIRNLDDYGYEWLQEATRNDAICVTFGAGRMLFGGVTSGQINLSKIADFQFKP